MATEPVVETQDDSIETPAPDKTDETNEDLLTGIPEEEEEEKPEGEEKDKVDASEIAQKKHWREKYFKLKEEAEKPKAEPKAEPEAKDDKEKAAENYLRNFFRKEYETLKAQESAEEQKAISEFEDKVTAAIEDNPDVAEDDLLEFIEKFAEKGVAIEPDDAVEMMKEFGTKKVEKPKLPAPKRGGGGKEKEEYDYSGKTMWQIAQDVLKDLKK